MPKPTAAAARVDKLEILQELPRGSMGTVHKARLSQSQRVMALRQFEVPQWLDDVQELQKQIMATAQSASQLQHPNIARVYTCGHKEFSVYVSAEFVDAPGIKEAMTTRTLSLNEVLAIAKQLGAALDYAHSKGVVHYCLTPANIKLLPDGTIRVLDFGLLKHKHLLSQTAVKKLENAPYLSPEEVRNRPVDRAANLFTLATILYELLTTRNPFGGKHLSEIERAITDLTPFTLTQANSRVPEAVSRVIMKGLAKNPAERFQSGEELVTALEEAMKGPMRASGLQSSGLQSAVPDIGRQTIRIPEPTLAALKKMEAAAAVTTSSGAPVPAAVASAATSTTTTTQARKPATVVKARPSAAKKSLWQWIAVSAAGALVLIVLAVVLLKPSKPAQAPPAAEAQANSAETEVTPPLSADAAPAIELREVTPKAGKAARPGRTQLPASTAAASPTLGELMVSSIPPDAVVAIEGYSQTWKTPQLFSAIPQGTYKVTISMAGYSTETRSVTVVAGNRAATEVKLNATKGVLSVGGTPAGAKVLIDGQEAAKLTPAEFLLEPGPHQIVVRKEGFLDAESTIKLTAGQPVSFAPGLKVAGRTDNIKSVGGGLSKVFGGNGNSGMARIEIHTQPKGARILINGMPFAKTTPVEIQVEPGNYTITLEKDGYKSVQKSVSVSLGDKLKLNETLPQ
ncbi:MAG TPA: serine/threonine-protein kinase [Candidatus Angelobacter sp.]|nr:serine/threonine-protein kinase [Candidatus Angelobacter sp.]